MADTLEQFLERAGGSPVLVSACLLGIPARYDCTGREAPAIVAFAREHCVIPVCPEQLGGLPTPRPRASIFHGAAEDVVAGRAQVMNEYGRDVTENFLRGAKAVADIAGITGARFAVLKERSPSCGVMASSVGFKTAEGYGVTAAYLKSKGIEVFGVE